MYRDNAPDLSLLAFAGALFHQPSLNDDVDMTLRIPCAPDEPTFGTGHHKHLCACGTAWKHDDLLPMFSTHEQFVESHACPACGTEQLNKHYGQNEF